MKVEKSKFLMERLKAVRDDKFTLGDAINVHKNNCLVLKSDD